MASILQPSHFAAVRAAIDTRLDAVTLTDSTIAQPIYQGAAELEIRGRDSQWATRTGDDKERLVQAAICLTAALILPAVPVLTGHVIGGTSKFNAQRNVAAQVAALRGQANTHLAVVGKSVEERSQASGPGIAFAVASGTRGY